MSENELRMKSKGESKIWNSLIKSNGKVKDISSTQLGQQILLDEALRIEDSFRTWTNKSSKVDRVDLKRIFTERTKIEINQKTGEDEEVEDNTTLGLILQTLLFLTGSASGALDYKVSEKKKTRHKKIKAINEKIFPEFSFELTWRVVEVIIDLSDYFQIDKSMMVINNKFSTSLGYTCTLDETIFDKLSTQALMSFYPMPMNEPPKDWKYENGEITGGYKSYQYDMVRVKKQFLNYGQYGQSIYDSINYIQSVPWRVNEEVLTMVQNDLRMPVKESYIKTSYPDAEPCKFHIKINDDEHGLTDEELEKLKSIRKDFQQLVGLYLGEVRDFESAMGKYRAVKMAIEIAHKYKGQTLYFPHSYDSRGRVYPIPVGLTPQGSDAVKALLEYENGETLNRNGAEWAFAYLASLYGDDKLHFEERVQRGMALMTVDYRHADEPYQFLAHQLELKKIIENPEAEFKGRIHLDACNSGSQFTSALTGDLAGCKATNVIPTIKEDGMCDRQDAYLLVSEKSKVLTKLKLSEDLQPNEKEVYELILNLLETKGRKICKTPVMVSNYGGTAGGRAELIYNMFRELNVERKFITQQNAIKMSKVIGDSIEGVLNGGKAFEKYIQKMNNMIAKKGLPIKWTTSDGFEVVHIKNKELKPKQVTLMLPNARRKTTITKKMYSNEVAPMKMRSAISPNYIHSLDAELLRRTALRMKDLGVKNSDWIHDSFGCLPNQVSEMLQITKEVFLEIMEAKPLEVLHEELRIQALYGGNTEKQLSKIEMPNLGGVDVDGGDLKILLDSEWFFS